MKRVAGARADSGEQERIGFTGDCTVTLIIAQYSTVQYQTAVGLDPIGGEKILACF